MIIAIKIILIMIPVFLAAYFAGSETGLYRISRLRLRVSSQINNKRGNRLLNDLLQDIQSVMFTVLFGTNLFQYITAALMTALLISLNVNDRLIEVYTTIIVTPVLFIFSEVIPKNIFYYHADGLMPRVAVVLWPIHKLFYYLGIVKLLKVTCYSIEKIFNKTASMEQITRNHYLAELASEGKEEGLLNNIQSDMISQLAYMSDIAVSGAMIPLKKTVKVNIKTNKQELHKLFKKNLKTEILVYKGAKQEIIGHLDVLEALNSTTEFANLSDITKDIIKVTPQTKITVALQIMAREGKRIALIEEKKRPIAIVTMRTLTRKIAGAESVISS